MATNGVKSQIFHLKMQNTSTMDICQSDNAGHEVSVPSQDLCAGNQRKHPRLAFTSCTLD